MPLSKYISNLLYHHDCIIIPGFGGFVANHRASFLNPAHHTFSPPSKKVAFNSSLRISDGLLANHVSKAMNISYREANEVIDQFVKNCVSLLANGERLVIDKIGVLYYDGEKNIQFTPDNAVNYLKESFGLTTIHSPAIKREDDVRKILHPIRTNTGIQRSRKIKSWRLIELIPAAAILTWLMLSPPVLNNINLNLGNLNPFARPRVIIEHPKEKADTKYSYFEQENNKPVAETKPVDTTTVEKSATENNTLKTASEELLATPKPPTSQPVVKEEKEITPEPKPIAEPVSTKVTHTEPATTQELSYVIGGCFRDYDNAVKYRDQALADGFQAAIIGQHKGLHMVSLFSSTDANRVTSEMALIKDKFQPQAWLFKK